MSNYLPAKTASTGFAGADAARLAAADITGGSGFTGRRGAPRVPSLAGRPCSGLPPPRSDLPPFRHRGHRLDWRARYRSRRPGGTVAATARPGESGRIPPQALRFVPGRNRADAANAFMNVSWVRSPASAALPVARSAGRPSPPGTSGSERRSRISWPATRPVSPNSSRSRARAAS